MSRLKSFAKYGVSAAPHRQNHTSQKADRLSVFQITD